MNALSQTSGMMLCALLALSTLFATGSSTGPLWLCDEAPADEAEPSWLPWAVLITFGVASGVAAVLQPLPFAAAFG